VIVGTAHRLGQIGALDEREPVRRAYSRWHRQPLEKSADQRRGGASASSCCRAAEIDGVAAPSHGAAPGRASPNPSPSPAAAEGEAASPCIRPFIFGAPRRYEALYNAFEGTLLRSALVKRIGYDRLGKARRRVERGSRLLFDCQMCGNARFLHACPRDECRKICATALWRVGKRNCEVSRR